MIHTRILTVLGLSVAVALVGCELDEPEPEIEVPGDLPAPVAEQADAEPQPFAPGVVPAHGDVTSVAPGPGGERILLAMSGEADELSRIWESRWDEESERYDEPNPLPFSRIGDADREPALAPTSRYLVFSSARPTPIDPAGGFNIWVTEWQDPETAEEEGNQEGWRDPWLIPLVSSPVWDGGPTLAASGNLYFASLRDGPAEGRSLYVSEMEDGEWGGADPLDPPVSSLADDVDPWVAPDESFLLFASDRNGAFDLYVSFRSEVGGWLDPLPLGDAVNTSANETAPAMSETGEYLFFHREGEGILWIPTEHADIQRPDEAADGGDWEE